MRLMQPPLPAASTRVPARATLSVAEKHSAIIRFTHWLNVPLLSIMIWSGFLIYWAASTTDHDSLHQVYRIGIGPWTLVRLFPDSFYQALHLDAQLTRGLAFHALFMWIFAANGLLYFLFLAISGQWRDLLPTPQDFARFAATFRRQFVRLPLSRRAAPRPGTKYNPIQRLVYTTINLMAVGSILTGIAIWKPTTLHFVTALCGGYQSARFLHFWLTIGFCLFFALHLLQVARSGWNNLRAMIIGDQIVSLASNPRLQTEVASLPRAGHAHE